MVSPVVRDSRVTFAASEEGGIFIQSCSEAQHVCGFNRLKTPNSSLQYNQSRRSTITTGILLLPQRSCKVSQVLYLLDIAIECRSIRQNHDPHSQAHYANPLDNKSSCTATPKMNSSSSRINICLLSLEARPSVPISLSYCFSACKARILAYSYVYKQC